MFEALFATIQEEEPEKWTDVEINDCLTKGERLDSDHVGITSTARSTTPRPLTPSSQSSNKLPPKLPPPLPIEPLSTNYVKEIASLAKLYTDENRYSGLNDNFDFKLAIFNNLYKKAGVSQGTKAIAYSTMLRGQALDHYHINDRNTNQADISFNDLCHFTRNYFEGPEYRRNCQTK